MLEEPQITASDSSLLQEQNVWQQISANKAEYQSLADAMPLMVWTAQSDGKFLYFNKRWFEYTGTQIHQIQDWQRVIHPDDLSYCLSCWTKSLETGELYALEYRLRRADGSYRWHLGRALPIRDDREQVVFWVGTCTDIDDQKRTGQQSQFLAEASRVLSASLDYQTTLMHVANLAVPQVADWCSVTIIGQDGSLQPLAIAHIDPNKIELARELARQYPEDPESPVGLPQVLRTGKPEIATHIPDALLVQAARDETHLKLLRVLQLTSYMIVPMIAQGRTLGAITFVTAESGRRYQASDLTFAENLSQRAALAIANALLFQSMHQELSERQRAEAALRESEIRFRTMADSAPVLLWVADMTGECHFFNQGWLNFTGRSLEQEMGNGWTEGIHPEDLSPCLATYHQALASRQPFEMEYRLRRADGEYRWILSTGQPRLLMDGQFTGYIGSCIDITDRKQSEVSLRKRAEELSYTTAILSRTATVLETRNRELDQFAYVISHDLKAPLRAISSLSEWLEEDLTDSLTPDTRRQMDLLRGRVHRMEALIDGLLQYSRVGRVEIQLETVPVEGLLRTVIDSLAPPATFQIEIAAGMPTLKTERLRLEQVFANLISNAIKYHDRPNGKIDISVSDRGAFYEFAVQDDGPGIAPQYHDKIFAIFQTLQPRDKLESTGIGLSLVKKIVEGQGGQVQVNSDLGQGASFRFTWPKQPIH